MRHATNNFIDEPSAVSYHKKHHIKDTEIRQRIEERDIIIGEPDLREGEQLSVEEGQYIITSYATGKKPETVRGVQSVSRKRPPF